MDKTIVLGNEWGRFAGMVTRKLPKQKPISILEEPKEQKIFPHRHHRRRPNAPADTGIYPSKGRNNSFPPTLLYSPGKTGQMSIESYLLDAGVKNLISIHSLDIDECQDGANVIKYFGGGVREERLARQEKVLKYLGLAKNIDVVIPIRDPLARNISSYFYNNAWYGNITVDGYVNTMNHDWVLDWFDEEIKRYFGVDIYTLPFDKEKGYSVNRVGRYNFLVIELSRLNSSLEAAVSEWLGRDCGVFNKMINSQDKSRYREFSKLKLPKELLDKMYNSKYARYFFTDNYCDEKILEVKE